MKDKKQLAADFVTALRDSLSALGVPTGAGDNAAKMAYFTLRDFTSHDEIYAARGVSDFLKAEDAKILFCHDTLRFMEYDQLTRRVWASCGDVVGFVDESNDLDIGPIVRYGVYYSCSN
jgi:hypothetical protein